MDPILDVRPVRPGLYTYSLRVPGQPARSSVDFFEVLALCFMDAAHSLRHYFDRVQIHLQGLPVGTYSVERLLREPRPVLEELNERFGRIYGPWTGHWNPSGLADGSPGGDHTHRAAP